MASVAKGWGRASSDLYSKSSEKRMLNTSIYLKGYSGCNVKGLEGSQPGRRLLQSSRKELRVAVEVGRGGDSAVLQVSSRTW